MIRIYEYGQVPNSEIFARGDLKTGVEETVSAIIADSPFSSPEAIIRKVCGDMKIPPVLLMPFVRLAARLLCGFDLRGASAVEAVRSANIPCLSLDV